MVDADLALLEGKPLHLVRLSRRIASASSQSGRKIPLTALGVPSIVPAPLAKTNFRMSKVCSITNAHPTKGSKIHRRGLAKKKGGIGQHVTKVGDPHF